MVSITSKNEHQSIVANLSRVAVSSRGLDASNHAEVGALHTWRVTLEGGALASHGVIQVLGVLSSKLSSSHMLEVCFERLISILDDEGVLHGDRSW
jgi:hypothetical protein